MALIKVFLYCYLFKSDISALQPLFTLGELIGAPEGRRQLIKFLLLMLPAI